MALDRDELDRCESGMRQITNQLRNTEALQHRPARWIQTVAANFFPGKIFPLKNERAQTGQRTKCGAARSSRPAAHDRDIKRPHRPSVSSKQGSDKVVFEPVIDAFNTPICDGA